MEVHTESLAGMIARAWTPLLIRPSPHLIPQIVRGDMMGRGPRAYKGTHRDGFSQWDKATRFVIAVHSVSKCSRRRHDVLHVGGEFLPLCAGQREWQRNRVNGTDCGS